MGEGAKDDIDACEIDLIDFRQRRYIEMPQMREDIAQLLTGLAIGGQRGDLDMAMRGEQADQFRAGVAGCAQDSGLECHEFSLGSGTGGVCSGPAEAPTWRSRRSEEHTSELQSL